MPAAIALDRGLSFTISRSEPSFTLGSGSFTLPAGSGPSFALGSGSFTLPAGSGPLFDADEMQALLGIKMEDEEMPDAQVGF